MLPLLLPFAATAGGRGGVVVTGGFGGTLGALEVVLVGANEQRVGGPFFAGAFVEASSSAHAPLRPPTGLAAAAAGLLATGRGANGLNGLGAAAGGAAWKGAACTATVGAGAGAGGTGAGDGGSGSETSTGCSTCSGSAAVGANGGAFLIAPERPPALRTPGLGLMP